VRIRLLGGFQVEHQTKQVAVSGAMQLAVLFRLAVDAGTAVSYRAISEDVWGLDAPENTRASLQSIVSRLRSQLPSGCIESTVGGYRLAVSRADVDALLFSDLIEAAAAAAAPDQRVKFATEALALWAGDPWTPSDNFDWFERDLRRDHARALEFGGTKSAVPDQKSSVPAPLTALIGRDEELATIESQLWSNRLVTIIGTGGAGKTRLAIEAATRAKTAILVELAPVSEGEVAGAVLTATGREIRMNESAVDPQSTRGRLLEALFGREILLVLDNCEHVIDATARLAQDLLGALPLLRILATSREPLGLAGEAFVGVGALAHPSTNEIARLVPTEIATYPAIELFLQRGTSATGTRIDDADLPAVAGICARLDGLPLAIELAAAKLRTMTVDEVLLGLEDRFALLSGGFRSALPRHQTLRAMIDWSWSLLSDDERRALAWFSVFPSGVAAIDASELSAGIGLRSSAVFDSLVDKSLLQRSRGRFRALETIREYGFERLSEAGEQVDARQLQARLIESRAVEFDRLLRGPRIMEALEWFDSEEDNIASALRFTVGMPMPDAAVNIAVSCIWYWLIRDRNEAASAWLSAVGPLASEVEGDAARILSLVLPFMDAFAGGEPGELMPAEFESQMAALVTSLGTVSLGAGSHELLQLIGPALSAFGAVVGQPDWMTKVMVPDGAEIGLDPWPTAVLFIARAAMSQNRGDVAALGNASGQAIEKFEAIGDLWGLALAQQMRAEWLVLDGQLEAALRLSDESTENMRRITTAWDLAQQQSLAVSILARLGRMADARSRVDQLLAEADADGNVRAIVQSRVTALMLDVFAGDVASAGTHIAEIDELIATWPGIHPQTIAMIESGKSGVAVLRGQLDAAENHARDAAAAAIKSQDQPIMGFVAIQVGALALARGDIAEAVRAVDVATVLIGAYDATHPQVRAIAEAADKAGIGRPGSFLPDRPIAIETLKTLVER
jgi:predicted ATPase